MNLTVGHTFCSGGFGHLIDDGGSGYALGRDVLSAAVRALDGRVGGSQRILEEVYAHLGVADSNGIVRFVYSPATSKATIADLARIALDLAAEDPQAAAILSRNSEDLFTLVQAVQKELKMESCPVALLGGLLLEDNPYRRIVAEKLAALGNPVAPEHDALWGAAQMAWEME